MGARALRAPDFSSTGGLAKSSSAAAKAVDQRHRRPHALAHADRIAETVGLDVAAAGWSPTVDSYLGRVTKARIVHAVRETKGEAAAQLSEDLKKGEMAERA